MRQIHKAGEKCFVDYAGLVVNITDPQTGEVTKAQVLVVMGASNPYSISFVLPGITT